jgi:RNA-directed DNA polymerase
VDALEDKMVQGACVMNHEWMLRFVEHRVGDARLIGLIRRWLNAGVLENGEVLPNETGTAQGGSISALLSNVYLHYVLDLWFEWIVKPRLRGEAYLVRYIDDLFPVSVGRLPRPECPQRATCKV